MTEPLRLVTADQTDVGSYFVATYPPFSVWNQADVERAALPALQTPPAPGAPLGLYLHIPFCRKRCHFCYFRVYTDKNAEDVTGIWTPWLANGSCTPRMPAIEGRPAQLRLLRRRHPVVSVHHAASGTGEPAQGDHCRGTPRRK